MMMENSRRQWENQAVFMKSLGWRVSTEWVAREVKMRIKLEDEPEVFSFAEDHLILWFKTGKECAMVRKGVLSLWLDNS